MGTAQAHFYSPVTPTARLKSWCRRVCANVYAEVVESVRAIRGYWWMFLAMIVAISSWVGWMHEREDKLQRLAILETELADYRATSSLTKERILEEVRENHATLQTLLRAQQVGPRHTACDTKAILQDLRAQGMHLPPYPVEERCGTQTDG